MISKEAYDLGDYCDLIRLRPGDMRVIEHPAGIFCCLLPNAATQAPRTPDFRPVRTRTQRYSTLTMPYVDINPHKGRPKWVGYTILAVLLVLTAAVVSVALIHH